MKQSCKDFFILAELLPTVWLIIGYDNTFNIEVNGAFAICAQLTNAKSE